MGRYKKPKRRDAVSDKLRYMANQGLSSVEGVVRRSIKQTHEDLLYDDFVQWMKYKNVSPDEFRNLYKRYYDEFIGGL
jgi:hypothetical protein